ncbi:MAG: hypothetical protein JRL30_05800 [Deltaproteobacteria bacterium]|nr:hypothetical protein [Deltaproteobacteria bacterium]
MLLTARLRLCFILALLAILIVAADGSGISHAYQLGSSDSRLVKAAYAAADHMENNLVYKLDRVIPILSTGFVNLDNRKGSSFGRLLGEQVASRFSQHGYKVIDLRAEKSGLFEKKANDKPGLSRETKGISALCAYDAQAIIVGDYVVSDDLAYVSVRLIRIPDSSILTSCDFTVRLDGALKEMAKRAPPDHALTQPPVKTKAAKPTEGKPSDKGPEQKPHETKTTKKLLKKPVEKPKNGPFATGTIPLNPRNRLAAKIIQTRLAELGFYKAKIDGIWKHDSQEALKEFKKAKGLRYAFTWDMKTQKALFRGTGQ